MSLQLQVDSDELLHELAQELARLNTNAIHKGITYDTASKTVKRKYRKMAHGVLMLMINKKLIQWKTP